MWNENLQPLLAPRHVYEAAEVELVGDSDGGGGTVAVFADDDVGLAGAGVVAFDGVGTVEQDDHVGVLLEAARFAKVRDLGAFVGALFGATVELGDGDDGDL